MKDEQMKDEPIRNIVVRYRSLLLCSSFICSSFIAFPLHASVKDELKHTQKAIEQSEEKQAQLAEQTEQLQAELKDLQASMVTLADAIQKGEADISDTEEKLRILNEQLKEKNAALKQHQKNLEYLIQAALSLSRTPAEAMIMMPTNAMDSMKSARALKMASDDIRKETQSIAAQMVELKVLEDKVSKDHAALVAKQAVLDKHRKGLADKLAKRTELLKRLGGESKREAEKLAKLAKKAEDLKGLLASIKKESKEREEEEAKQENQASEELRSFVDAKGHIRPPVAGHLVTAFGAAQGRNSTSKGVVVASRPGARVTAPYDGEVVFTGPFLGYGQMVIIRHSDDFHTLLAGLVKIDVEVGQFLLEGEPIGAMGDSESGSKLYIELRKDSQPVDPALWINGLKKKH